MEQETIVNMNFDEIIALLKLNSIDTDVGSIIYNSLDQIIKSNYLYDSKEENEEYAKLLVFFKNLIILHDVNLIRRGFKIFYSINKNLFLCCDLALAFLENEMLKEYYEMIIEYNYDPCFDDIITEAIDHLFSKVKSSEIYHLITETSLFVIKSNEHQLMRFIVDKWISKDLDTKEMSYNDIKKITTTIDLLNNILSKKLEI